MRAYGRNYLQRSPSTFLVGLQTQHHWTRSRNRLSTAVLYSRDLYGESCNIWTGRRQLIQSRKGDKHEINDSLESFVSGHSTAAFAGFLFLSLWFNAVLKVFADYRAGMWKLVFFFAPLLGATLIAGSLTIGAALHSVSAYLRS